MIPATTERVPAHTDQEINERIRRQTEENIRRFTSCGAEMIDWRMQKLDREWDTERLLETSAASFSLLGFVLGAAAGRKWFILPAVVSAFLLQHAIQGWCPPLWVIRRLGVRTAREINHERCALKAARGDFREISGEEGRRPEPGQVLRAAER